ncbi:MAG: VPLPA-CTERM-specific exosortase XrtD [Methylovulum sp.]|nr:VPLPA-CTERM-specific exosortase XrtD [Methylovulum sp.]MCF8007661.1 VPLPA-CTERM-specific exosortase XrtD [Methylovulum sp.]
MNTPQKTVWKFGPLNWLLIGIAVIVPVFAFWKGLSELPVRWDKQEEYSHGYLIPLLTAYFIWQKKIPLQQIDFSPAWTGLTLVIIALVFCLIGEISALYLLIHYGFILILIGMAWAMMGWKALKLVLLPLLLLIFAIPIPYFLEAQLSANLQLLSSKLGVFFIRWCEIPVYLEGNVIDLGDYKLQVVEACSGLRYLFPLMSLGFICAYLFDVPLWKRALVFLSTIPITLLMNSFRIGMIGILVNYWGIAMAEGFLHDFEGWIVFMACLGILLLEMWLLVKLGKDSRPFNEVFGLLVTDRVISSDLIKTRTLSKPFLAGLVCLSVATIFIQTLDKREEIIPLRNSFINFPLQINEWRGKNNHLDNDVFKLLKLTDYVLADFEDKELKPVNFYSAYYATQRKGESPHSPQVCIPGGGWQITDIERIHWNDLKFNRIVIKKDNIKQLVYYWFQQRGRMIANEYWMKWYLFEDALLLHRTDGALVRITTLVYPDEQEKAADERLKRFTMDALPLLPEYLPN